MAMMNPNMMGGDATAAFMGQPQEPEDFFTQFGGSTKPPGGYDGSGIGAGLPGTGGVQTPQVQPQAQAGGGLTGDAAYEAFGRGLMATGGKTVAELKAYADQWNAQNPNAQVTLGGSKGDKVYGPGGEFWQDAVISAGTGGTGFNWGPKAASGGMGGGPLGSQSYGPGSFGSGFQQDFHAPTGEEARNTPGYQFALGEGVKALDTRNAAVGNFLSGGQEKKILSYATGLADQTYQRSYQNALGEYMNAANIFRSNQNDVYDRYDRIAQRGTNAANSATS